MLICIDHGNKLIKTKNTSFISGISQFQVRPPFGDKILEYNNKFYSLSNKRNYYMKDKTLDDNFFILTLFSIIEEIKHRKVNFDKALIDIKLVVGLPPSHYGTLHDKLEKYFLNRGEIRFSFNSKDYLIDITSVQSYPQSYSAVISRYNDIKELHRAIVLDIGGYTADYLVIRKGKPDLDYCESLDNGIVILYNNIIKRAKSDADYILEENDIDDIIKCTNREFNTEVTSIVHSETEKFVNSLLGDLSERKLNTGQDKLILVGGGGILLKNYFISNTLTNDVMIIDDIYANVKGYEMLYKLSNNSNAYE